MLRQVYKAESEEKERGKACKGLCVLRVRGFATWARMTYHRLDLPDRGIDTLDGLKDVADRNFVTINLAHNALRNFDHFGTHPYLTELDVRDNAIDSMLGLTRQRSLAVLRMQGNPIARHPLYRLMVLLVIGFSVDEIDGRAVTERERGIAKTISPHAALAVSYGWLLDMHPRSATAYHTIIEDCRRLRLQERRRRHPTTTLRAVLAQVQGWAVAEGKTGGGTTTAEAAAAAAMNTAKVAEADDTVTRLSLRVAELQTQLSTLQNDASGRAADTVAMRKKGRQGPSLPSSALVAAASSADVSGSGRPASVAGTSSGGERADDCLGWGELQLASCIEFVKGIQVATNVLARGSGDAAGFERACVRLSADAVTVLSFMERQNIAQLCLTNETGIEYVAPMSIVLQDHFGVMLHLRFDAWRCLRAVFKCLYLLTARPVPELPTFPGEQDIVFQRLATGVKATALLRERAEQNVDGDARANGSMKATAASPHSEATSSKSGSKRQAVAPEPLSATITTEATTPVQAPKRRPAARTPSTVNDDSVATPRTVDRTAVMSSSAFRTGGVNAAPPEVLHAESGPDVLLDVPPLPPAFAGGEATYGLTPSLPPVIATPSQPSPINAVSVTTTTATSKTHRGTKTRHHRKKGENASRRSNGGAATNAANTTSAASVATAVSQSPATPPPVRLSSRAQQAQSLNAAMDLPPPPVPHSRSASHATTQHTASTSTAVTRPVSREAITPPRDLPPAVTVTPAPALATPVALAAPNTSNTSRPTPALVGAQPAGQNNDKAATQTRPRPVHRFQALMIDSDSDSV